MITFIRRHTVATLLCVVSLILTFAASWLFGGFQIGLGPEFIVKAFAKLFYLGFALVCMHMIIKYMFPTIYSYCNTEGDTEMSEFQRAWRNYKIGIDNPELDKRVPVAVQTHLGVFIAVCLLLALAF